MIRLFFALCGNELVTRAKKSFVCDRLNSILKTIQRPPWLTFKPIMFSFLMNNNQTYYLDLEKRYLVVVIMLGLSLIHI